MSEGRKSLPDARPPELRREQVIDHAIGALATEVAALGRRLERIERRLEALEGKTAQLEDLPAGWSGKGGKPRRSGR